MIQGLRFAVLLALLIPAAAFSQVALNASTTAGCAPLTVSFSVTAGGQSTYFWDFGDGTTSTAATPNHTFAFAGYYNVYVEVWNAFGGFIGWDNVIINVAGDPGYMNMSKDSACIGDEISFYINNGIDYDSYAINFGDGSPVQTNTWGSFYHEYTANGAYNVSLTSNGPCGSFTVDTVVHILSGLPVENGFLDISPQVVCPGNEVNVWTEWDYDYVFDFGDGSTPDDESRHYYSDTGTYVITVFLENGCGADTSITGQVSVEDDLYINPSEVYINHYDDPECPNTPVNFGTASGYTYDWDFGDGGTSNLQYPSHIYSAPGNYSYSVTLVNGCGRDTILYDTATIQNNLPVANLGIETSDSICVNELMLIYAGPGGLSYQWDLGDGSTASGEEITHAYSAPGDYTITLTGTNACGNSAQTTFDVHVGTNLTPDINDYIVNVFPEEACPGDTVMFIGGPASGGATYEWDFGNGSMSNGPGVAFNVMGLPFDIHKSSYTSDGVYTATLTITNGCGNSVSATQDVSIGGGAVPEPQILYDMDEYNCLNEPVEFKAVGGEQFIWNFGDGTGNLTTTQTLSSVYHTYDQPGTYIVTLTGINTCGLSDTYTQEVFIPDSRMQITTNTVDANCGESNGIALVSVTGVNAPFTYGWTNGDSTVIADSLASGIYQVNITDAKGCTDFAIATVSDVEAPTIVVSSVIDVSCYDGSNGAIDINLIGSSGPYTYAWSNGSASQDINNLNAGPYELVVEDANGCISAESIIVNEPSPTLVTISKQNASCGVNDGRALVNVSGSAAPYTYIWDNGLTGQAINGLSEGVYSVNVIDGNGCLYQESVDISETGGPVIKVDSILNPGCGAGSNSIYLNTFAGTAPYSYMWSNGATTEDLVSITPGTYTVRITGQDGCSSVRTFDLGYEIPGLQDICLVTVDSATQKNLVVWEKTALPGDVASYNVYKESSQSGLYFMVGNVPYDSLSQFLDVSADPSIRSWRYKITAVDSCGNESAFSPIHKTIHLTNNMGINGEVNLIWDHYAGINYSTYNLWRYSNTDGWTMIQAMPSNLNSYTDAAPPAGATSLYYRIEAVPNAGCVANRAVSHNTTRSNRSAAVAGPITSIEEGETNSWLSLYPNPGNDNVTLNFHVEGVQEAFVFIYDMNGRLVMQKAASSVSGQDQLILNITALQDGMYSVILRKGQAQLSKRLIIQR